MAHQHDINCKWCGAELWGEYVYWEDAQMGECRTRTFIHGICRKKPPQTPEEGAAAAGGLLLMAMAIRETYLCSACGCWQGRGTYPCQCENDE